MTETAENTVAEALELVDSRLAELQSREIIAASQVADMLLDLRLLLTEIEPAAPPAIEPVLAP